MFGEEFKLSSFSVEVKLITRYVTALRMFNVREEDIGIIAPYVAQV